MKNLKQRDSSTDSLMPGNVLSLKIDEGTCKVQAYFGTTEVINEAVVVSKSYGPYQHELMFKIYSINAVASISASEQIVSIPQVTAGSSGFNELYAGGSQVNLNRYYNSSPGVVKVGDSRMELGTNARMPNQDITSIRVVIPASGSTPYGSQGGMNMALSLSRPDVRYVGNFGITGQTTTQILARSDLPASPTRKAIEDIATIKRGFQLIELMAGVNDWTLAAEGTYVAQARASAARIKTIIEKLLVYKVPVYVKGNYGIRTGATGYTDIASAAAASALCDSLVRQICSQYPLVKFRSWEGILCDNGVLRAEYTNDGLHANNILAHKAGPIEAEDVADLYYSSKAYTYEGRPINGNADFAVATNGIASGVSKTGNATTANDALKVINGKLYQTTEATAGAANATFQFNYDLNIINSGLKAGDEIAFEWDVLVRPLNKANGDPSPFTVTIESQLRLQKGAGTAYVERVHSADGMTGDFDHHIPIFPVELPEDISGLTTVTARLQIAQMPLDGKYLICFAEPRLVPFVR